MNPALTRWSVSQESVCLDLPWAVATDILSCLLTQYITFNSIQLGSNDRSQFSLHGQIVVHCVHVLYSLCPFIIWWTFRLSLFLGCCEWCLSELCLLVLALTLSISLSMNTVLFPLLPLNGDWVYHLHFFFDDFFIQHVHVCSILQERAGHWKCGNVSKPWTSGVLLNWDQSILLQVIHSQF